MKRFADTLTQLHSFKRGSIVQVWCDDGRGGGNCYGVVTAAGRIRIYVTWESGLKQRLPRHRWHLIEHVPENMRDEALRSIKSVMEVT